jgi:glycerate kinase
VLATASITQGLERALSPRWSARESLGAQVGQLVRAASADGRTLASSLALGAVRGFERSEFELLTSTDVLVSDDASATSVGVVHRAGARFEHALARGVRRILLGIGGSATNEAGAGMAQALGIQFRDLRGRTLRAPLGGGDLAKVADIVVTGRDPRLAETTLLVACDVTNPLVGPRGASAIYGPQKGATPAQVRELEQNLRTFGRLASQRCGKPLLRLPGGGAAGGLGAGLVAFAGGQLVSGAQTVMAIAQLERQLQGADLVITGEGKLDAQTRFGKTPASVAALAQRMGIPVVGLAGMLSCDANVNHSFGFDALLSAVVAPENSASALRNARGNLIAAAERLGHWLLLAQRLPKR